uniref:helix-turn-helix domain-containing protein n=2 Tax=Salinibacter ruber TaxID=146919 RepID=UPI002073262B
NNKTAAMATKQTYNTEEVAEAIDMHPNSIRRNLQRDEIRGRKIGNQWVITQSALREWLGDELFEIHFANEEEA